MEVLPDVHQLKVPIPDNPLGYINSYLIKTEEGCLLIDTGWNTDEAFDSLASQLQQAGVTWSDLRYIAITHAHPDHYGLVGRLVKYTRAQLVIHEIEQSFLRSRYLENEILLEEMDLWLRINGVPEDSRPALQKASMEVLGLVVVAMPDIAVRGGESLKLGDLDFKILWTPGHSAGHICLYEMTHRFFFSGDHVLPDITPNVSMHAQSIGNPLADYLSSLRQVAKLPVDIALPAHGEVFYNFRQRVKEIEEHHKDRKQVIIHAFENAGKTAYQIAATIPWSTGGKPWTELPPIIRRMAVTETLAHLELLFAEGVLTKELAEGIVLYTPTRQAGL